MKLTIYSNWELLYEWNCNYFSYFQNNIKFDNWELKLSSDNKIYRNNRLTILNWQNVTTRPKDYLLKKILCTTQME